MRRIEPVFPDLLPLSHRLGAMPATTNGVRLDPVEMRLIRGTPPKVPRDGDRSIPRRPVRVLVHARVACDEKDHVTKLWAAGCGFLVILDDELDPGVLPAPFFAGQIVVLAPWLPGLWGGGSLPALEAWRERGVPAGVLVGLAPAVGVEEQVRAAVMEAHRTGAQFVVSKPVALPAEDRHLVYDRHSGDAGDEQLENLLFHSDLGQVGFELERETTRVARRLGLAEGLPGPATAGLPQPTFAAGAALLLWARRLDLLDGVSSAGWELRRAAHALLASGREVRHLIAEDNLRIVPGFTPWVEAFARALWGVGGEPFDGVLERWIGQ